jgi:hypothetical protein
VLSDGRFFGRERVGRVGEAWEGGDAMANVRKGWKNLRKSSFFSLMLEEMALSRDDRDDTGGWSSGVEALRFAWT